MGGDFLDLVGSEIERIPTELRAFVVRRAALHDDEQSWSFFAYGYSKAFEELTLEMLAAPRRDYLRLPLFFLCRHSLELAFKNAISECSSYTGGTPNLDGHSLATLWGGMIEQITLAGYSVDDDWTAYCAKVVQQFHNADPTGERFRYPFNVKGSAFNSMKVDVTELAKAYWNLTTYCDAVVSMFHASDGYS